MKDSNFIKIPDTSPIKGGLTQRVEAILKEMSPSQCVWLGGFLSGLAAPDSNAGSGLKPRRGLVLYGTESGNAEAAAAGLHSAIRAQGAEARLCNMADYSVADLASEDLVLVIVSTWGEGDPPESATSFFEDLLSDRVPGLKGVEFAVFGLGDSSYADFCECGKVVDRRLEELGAQRVLPRIDADVDYEAPFADWSKQVLALFQGKESATVIEESSVAATPEIVYGKKQPFPATVTELVRLSGRGSAKNTCHMELSLKGSGMSYKPGDVVGVFPRNSDQMVDEILQLSGFDGDSSIEVGGEGTSLRSALESKFDITALGLPFAKKYAALTENADLESALSEEKLGKFKEWMVGRELRDLLKRFPLVGQTPEQFVGILRKMPPRLYSIASSWSAHPDEVHLTVGAVYYETHGLKREGVCSSYLCDRIERGQSVDIYTHTNKNFFLPENPETPIIMVGPGTGIAPFRAFVEERAATGAPGRNWLFFGEQHFNEDFLYQLEWQDYLKRGVLSRMDVAFSRDTPRKVYVQHRMLEAAKELYAWLQEGAYFYVCGDASRMAKDVHEALVQIYEEVGGQSEELAREAVQKLVKEKRYQKDVY